MGQVTAGRVLLLSLFVGLIAMNVSFILFDPRYGQLVSKEEYPLIRRSIEIECSQGVFNGTDCVCFPGYVTYPEDNPQQCAYPVKDRTTAFLFSVLFCYLGLDQFYLGHYALGACKLIFGIFTLGIWWIIDWILIGAGYYYDKNGVPMSDWYFNQFGPV